LFSFVKLEGEGERLIKKRGREERKIIEGKKDQQGKRKPSHFIRMTMRDGGTGFPVCSMGKNP